ncbi:TAZ zinc finger family protein [Aphelenchoides avenae]|nr:TAZ zinc finger family protein [Aphelenchus avenae]
MDASESGSAVSVAEGESFEPCSVDELAVNTPVFCDWRGYRVFTVHYEGFAKKWDEKIREEQVTSRLLRCTPEAEKIFKKTVKLLTQKTERSTNGRRRVKSSTPSASRTLSRSSRKRTATPSGNGVVDTKRLLLKREPCTEEKPSANVLTFAATPPSRRGQAWLDEDSDADSGVAMSRKAQDTPTSTRSASYTTKRTDQQPRGRPDTDEEASMPTTTASDISETSEGVTSIECLVTEPEFTTKQEVLNALEPVVTALWKDESSAPFRNRQEANEVEGRYGVIKPLGLHDIRQKLEKGEYSDIVNFRRDMGTLFANARLLYEEASPRYRNAEWLHKLYISTATPVFLRQGFCCADTHYLPREHVRCSLCQSSVEWGEWYYRRTDLPPAANAYACEQCWASQPEDHMSISVDDILTEVPKTNFLRLRHNQEKEEPLVDCSKCGREFHAVCVGYVKLGKTVDYVCKRCGGMPADPTTRPETIPQSELSRFMEDRVDAFIKSHELVTSGEVTSQKRVLIRVGSSDQFMFKRGPAMAERYGKKEFLYTYRTIYAFQEDSDGEPICFFSLHAQEYGPESPAPDRGHVYLAFFEDSVKSFRPAELRRHVYHRILLAYLEWLRDRGFARLSLWACPPMREDICYLFPGRATDGRVMTVTALCQWYKGLFSTGKAMGIVRRTLTAVQAYSRGIRSADNVPYFEGDHLAQMLDDAADGAHEPSANVRPGQADDVVKRFLGQLKALAKDWLAHFVVDLLPIEQVKAVVAGSQPIKPDPDPLVRCDAVGDRDEFFARCVTNSVRFSSTRLAKYGTKCLCRWINTEQGLQSQ